MTGNTVNGSRNGPRSGALALGLLTTPPLNCAILEALTDGPKQQMGLRHATGSPAQSTLRTQLSKLTASGALEKRRHDRFPGTLEYDLTLAGRELLFVAGVLKTWLALAEGSPLSLESMPGRAATRTLVKAWSSTLMRTLAAGPLSLTELDSVIGSLSYPSLERLLTAMRLAAQVEAQAGGDRGRPYAVTEWLRRGVAPIIAAARWERTHLPESTPVIGRMDMEAVLLLTIPLVQLDRQASGTCSMGVEIRSETGRRLVGVTVKVENGSIASCTTRLSTDADCWVLASPVAWFDALTDGVTTQLELGGDSNLALLLLDRLHHSLFGVAADSRGATLDSP